jgi:hypothetical protein
MPYAPTALQPLGRLWLSSKSVHDCTATGGQSHQCAHVDDALELAEVPLVPTVDGALVMLTLLALVPQPLLVDVLVPTVELTLVPAVELTLVAAVELTLVAAVELVLVEVEPTVFVLVRRVLSSEALLR